MAAPIENEDGLMPQETSPCVTREGTTFCVRARIGSLCQYTYYLGVRYGHPGAERVTAFLVKSDRLIDALAFLTLKPALAEVIGEGKPLSVEVFRRLADEG